MKSFFISDLHLGHKNIVKHSMGFRMGNTVEEHNEWIVDCWNSVVGKNDCGYILGDVAFGAKNLAYLARMNGQKFLVRGNHDKHNIKEYLKYFTDIYGIRKVRGFWLSHAPVHPGSLRQRFNIHGHVHQYTLKDLRYINVSVEALCGIPRTLESLELMAQERLCLMKSLNPDNPFSITGASIVGITETSVESKDEG